MTPIITSTKIDFIGDIHGHADELRELLQKELGYLNVGGYFKHPARKAFFVGDFIDRGPQIKEVLEIVRPMIENRSAYTVVGNHEYNAICYWTKAADGNYLRHHTQKNEGQHRKTIDSFHDPELLIKYVDWFRTLPIYLANGQFKSVHAQWKEEYIDYLKREGINNFGNQEFLISSATKGTSNYKMIDCLLKGEERDVPGVTFKDKDGNERFSYRLKWWLTGDNLPCEDALFEFPSGKKINETPIASTGYPADEVPVFFGHYWLKDARPKIQQGNVCCLDFSVAKGGILVAYRWDGENKLDKNKFVWCQAKGNHET